MRPFPEVPQPAAVWQRAKLFGVHIKPLTGQPAGDQPTLELVYEVDWDHDHLLGVRLREWRIWEVCGSA